MTPRAFYPALEDPTVPLEGNLFEHSLSASLLGSTSKDHLPKSHLIVIDSAVDNIEQLTANLDASRVVILERGSDSIQQISQAIAPFNSTLESLHIISHAEAGALQLGNSRLDAAGLASYADEITGWGEAIAPEGDILLYGCNLAAGQAGETFIAQLSQLTGADVAASDDLTGSGGDWDLEAAAGSIEAQVVLDTITQGSYSSTLAIVDSYDVKEYNGSYYWLADAQTWEAAQAEARSTSSNLVTINSAAEDSWLKETFGTGEHFWMGMTDASQEGTFQWASGEAVTYTNWAPGEPNDWQGTQDFGRTNFGDNQQWDDDHVYSAFRGIIEYGSNASEPEDPNPKDDIFSRIVPVNYSGYNTDIVELSDWSNVSAVSALGSAAKSVGAQTLRLPGGDGANYWDWDIGGIIEDRNPFTLPHDLIQPLPLSINYKDNLNATLENVKPLIDSSGAEPIWVVNMNTSSLEKEIRHLVEAEEPGL